MRASEDHLPCHFVMLDFASVWHAISVLCNRFSMVFLSNMLSLNIYLLYWSTSVYFLYQSFLTTKRFLKLFLGLLEPTSL